MKLRKGQKLKKRLRNHYGFTLAETLVAVIILLLVSTIVARGVPVAKNAYEKVVVGANARVMLTTAITALRNELSTAQRIEQIPPSDTKSISYYSADRGATSKLYINNGDTNYPDGTIMIQEFEDYKSDDALFNVIQGNSWEVKDDVATKPRPLTSVMEAQRGRTDDWLYVTCDSIQSICLNPTAEPEKQKYKVVITGLKVCRSSDTSDKPLAQFGETESVNTLTIRVIPNQVKFADAAEKTNG